MRLKIAYSKVKKRNLVLINNDTYQRGTVSERPIRPPLNGERWKQVKIILLNFGYIVLRYVITKYYVSDIECHLLHRCFQQRQESPFLFKYSC